MPSKNRYKHTHTHTRSDGLSNTHARAALENSLRLASAAAGVPSNMEPMASPMPQRNPRQEHEVQGPAVVLPDPESPLCFSGASTCSQGGMTISSKYSPPAVCFLVPTSTRHLALCHTHTKALCRTASSGAVKHWSGGRTQNLVFLSLCSQ